MMRTSLAKRSLQFNCSAAAANRSRNRLTLSSNFAITSALPWQLVIVTLDWFPCVVRLATP